MILWVIHLFLGFVLRQVAQFGAKFDWKMFKADWDVRIEKLVIWDALDETAVLIFNNAVDVVAGIISSAEVLSELVSLIEAKDFAGAIELLKKKIFEVIAPGSEMSEAALIEGLKSYKKASA